MEAFSLTSSWTSGGTDSSSRTCMVRQAEQPEIGDRKFRSHPVLTFEDPFLVYLMQFPFRSAVTLLRAISRLKK